MGKRCLSRSVSVENLELYSQPNGCCKASPASSFSPDLAAIFQLSDISRELSFDFPFSFAGKEKGRPCSPVAQTVLLAVFFGYKQRVYPGFRVKNRVTPHSMRGPERGRKGSVFCKCFCRYFLDSTSMCGMTKAGIPGSRIGVRDD